jgi:hypothetical protein
LTATDDRYKNNTLTQQKFKARGRELDDPDLFSCKPTIHHRIFALIAGSAAARPAHRERRQPVQG